MKYKYIFFHTIFGIYICNIVVFFISINLCYQTDLLALVSDYDSVYSNYTPENTVNTTKLTNLLDSIYKEKDAIENTISGTKETVYYSEYFFSPSQGVYEKKLKKKFIDPQPQKSNLTISEIQTSDKSFLSVAYNEQFEKNNAVSFVSVVQYYQSNQMNDQTTKIQFNTYNTPENPTAMSYDNQIYNAVQYNPNKSINEPKLIKYQENAPVTYTDLPNDMFFENPF